MAVYTGLRAGELVNLRWEHIDLDNQSLLVRNTDDFKTKTRRERIVPLVPSHSS
ncbi:MAG: tyrosine-type recombinase/integrase [Rhodothermales bacterium]